MDWSTILTQGLLSAVLSGGVVAAVIALLGRGWSERVAAQVKEEFERRSTQRVEDRQWRERVLGELLGPVAMQLDRTSRAFDRWRTKNIYLESKIIKTANEAIRDLLLQKGYLLPLALSQDAALLVEHYDRWLEQFERFRGGSEPDLEQPFVFVGPEGFPFPRDAEQHFKAEFHLIWTSLYGTSEATLRAAQSASAEWA